MKIAYISAGAAGMYCGTCMHDNTLAATLMELGHEVSLTPTYTPMRTDEPGVAVDNIFFGAINVYLKERFPRLGALPKPLAKILDRPALLNWVSRFSASTDGHDLGAMTLSMLNGEEGRQAAELERLTNWLEEIIQPEVVHLSFTLFAGFAKTFRQRLNVPIVCSLQGEDLFFEELIEPYRTQIFRTLKERLDDIDAFTAPCRFTADLMSEQYGVPRDRIAIVPLGIDPRGFRSPEIESKEEPRATTTIGYLARMAPEKGLHTLLDAFRVLSDDDPSLRLRAAGYVGPGNRQYFQDLQNKVVSWGLADRIELLGEIDHQQKVDFLNEIDLLCVPTEYRETKGIFVAEALVCGNPVVLPAHGSFPEWIEATEGGVLFEPGSQDSLIQALRSLCSDQERRRQHGETGRTAVLEKFDNITMAETTLALYQELIRARSTQAEH